MEEIRFRSFVWLCIKQAIRGSWEKADSISVFVGFVLGAIAYFIPSIETKVTHSLLIVPLISLASVTVSRVLVSPFLVYRKRDAEALKTETSLRESIAAHQETICALQPKYTPAEQSRRETVKKALNTLGNKGINALRFLREHGAMKFGVYNPPNIPAGLTANDMQWVFDHCSTVGIVRREDGKLGTGERTYQISDAMAPILDELLYENGTTSAPQ